MAVVCCSGTHFKTDAGYATPPTDHCRRDRLEAQQMAQDWPWAGKELELEKRSRGSKPNPLSGFMPIRGKNRAQPEAIKPERLQDPKKPQVQSPKRILEDLRRAGLAESHGIESQLHLGGCRKPLI